MDKYKFGEFIYNQRKKLGLTQDELGRKLNVTNKAVSKWETGETLPDIQLLEKLASTLNVTIDELLTQKKPKVETTIKKPKIYLYIIHALISLALLIVIVLLFIKPIGEEKIEFVSQANAENYFSITPCEKSYLNDLTLTIYGSITEKKEIIEPELVLAFSIQYYYFNDNNELSEILYVGRKVTYTGETRDFSIIVEPKDPISNYKSFYGFNVNYEIVDAKGRVEKSL